MMKLLAELTSLSFSVLQFVLSAVGCDMTDIMLNTVRKCLVSADKFEVVRGELFKLNS